MKGEKVRANIRVRVSARTSIRVKVLYWAHAREVAGKREEIFILEKRGTISQLIEKVLKKHPGLASLHSSIRIAVNGELSRDSEVLKDGDEVALLPPVAGG